MADSSPLTEGLLLTHKVISRGLEVSLRKCDGYIGKPGIPAAELRGLSMYVKALKCVTHAHHLSEDEIAFPYFRNLIEAPYDILSNDHLAITDILDKMENSLAGISSDGTGRLNEALSEFNQIWGPHIAIEELNFAAEKLHKVTNIKQQADLTRELSEHSRKNAGPGPLVLPFLIYNLEGKERELFTKPIPWIVRKVLVPVVWKGQWKPMEQFFLPD